MNSPGPNRIGQDKEDWKRCSNFISRWNRGRKWDLFREEFDPSPDTTLLDVGYSDEEYQVTDNFIEKHYKWPANITALGIEEPTTFERRYPDVRVVVYDGRLFPFDDGTFDIVWSNAVVEHVGDRESQITFLREVARTGRRAFVTTPNRFFPVEVHSRTPLLHFLPKPLFDAYLRRIGKPSLAGDYMRLLSHRELRRLLSRAGITDYKIKKNRLFGFTLDFVVIVGASHK